MEWYDGSPIEIRNDGGWRPLETKGKKAYENAKFSSKVVSDAEWTLIETRENGDIRHFQLTKNEKTNTLVVQLMNKDGSPGKLTWRLVNDEDKPFTGRWVDEAMEWYDGSPIEIRSDGEWRPLATKGREYENAKFSSKVVSDAEWTLIETRENGDIRHFKLTKNE